MDTNLPLALVMVLLVTGGLACRQSTPPAQPPSLSAEDKALEAWFTCEECTSGQLDAVLKLGQAVVPRLSSALRNGPTQATVDNERRRLATTHQSIVEYAKSHPDAAVPISQQEFIDSHVEKFITLYQVRAATALGAIGGPEAKNALTEVQGVPLRPEVLNAVQTALRRFR